MANDRHQSAFDQDEFDRYDTFDAPVTEDVNPDRSGFFGDFGRLLDEIRIANAADKLDDNVAVGEDRALHATGNWAAVPHEQLYASVHTNNNPSEAYALAREWTDLGNMMAENSRVMDATIRSTEAGWRGPAAEVARQATLKLATWGGDAAQTSQYMGTRIADQGLAAERAKATMPEPQNFDYESMLRDGFASGGLAGLAKAVTDVQAASASSRAAHAQAVQVMSEMESQSRDVDQTTPRFVRPPEVTDGATDTVAVNGLVRTDAAPVSAPLRSDGTAGLPNGVAGGIETSSALASPGSVGSAGGSGLPGGLGGTAPAFSGAPGVPGGGGAANVPGGVGGPAGFGVSGGVGVPGGLGVPGGSGRGGSSSRQRNTPSDLTVPEDDLDTTMAGHTAPNLGGHTGGLNFGGTGFKPDNPDLTNFMPPPASARKGTSGGDANWSGHVPPKLPAGINPVTGLPHPPDEVRRGGTPGSTNGPGRVPGVGGAGGAGAAGVGGGFGRGGGMAGPGSYAGAVAAEQAAAARGGMGVPGSGHSGAAGGPGAGAPGAGRSGGGEDKEHRNKYVTNEKVIDEPGRLVPTVIGEKSAKQLKEEQPG